MQTPPNKTDPVSDKPTVAIAFVLKGLIVGSDKMTLQRAVRAIEEKFPAVKVTFSQLLRKDK